MENRNQLATVEAGIKGESSIDIELTSRSDIDGLQQQSHNIEVSSEYEFCGKHLIASYMSCDSERLTDHRKLDAAMREAIKASGATILEVSTQIFPGGGLTSVYLLSESHASIHTYPEHASCFIDIFTCGFTCEPLEFDRVLRDYFKAARVSSQIIIRGDSNSFEDVAQDR